jgi:hypothetical protein
MFRWETWISAPHPATSCGVALKYLERKKQYVEQINPDHR